MRPDGSNGQRAHPGSSWSISFLLEKAFHNQIREPLGIVPVETGNLRGKRPIPGQGDEIVPGTAEKIPLEFGPVDLNLRMGVDLEPLREDDVRVFDVAIPDFGEVIIPRRI